MRFPLVSEVRIEFLCRVDLRNCEMSILVPKVLELAAVVVWDVVAEML